jgi:hypothetical protein
MQISELWQQALLGMAGGMACEVLHWYSLARKPRGVSGFSKHPIYWLSTAGMILLGGVMPVLYLNGTASALLCFHLGAATPILLQKLVAAAPALAQRQGLEKPTLKEFYAW